MSGKAYRINTYRCTEIAERFILIWNEVADGAQPASYKAVDKRVAQGLPPNAKKIPPGGDVWLAATICGGTAYREEVEVLDESIWEDRIWLIRKSGKWLLREIKEDAIPRLFWPSTEDFKRGLRPGKAPVRIHRPSPENPWA